MTSGLCDNYHQEYIREKSVQPPVPYVEQLLSKMMQSRVSMATVLIFLRSV